eukprot:858002-Pelagomonas_calceolata.AAC.4
MVWTEATSPTLICNVKLWKKTWEHERVMHLQEEVEVDDGMHRFGVSVQNEEESRMDKSVDMKQQQQQEVQEESVKAKPISS